MSRTRKFVKRMQECLKGVDGMTPYMFPMIGKNYENATPKIIVVVDYIRKNSSMEEKLKAIDKNVSHEDLCIKDDIIRDAWENMRLNNKKIPKILEGECNLDDIIFTSFSRYSSKAKKFEHGINEYSIQGGFYAAHKQLEDGRLHRISDIFIQALIEYSNPDKVLFLGKSTERLVLEIPKKPTKEDLKLDRPKSWRKTSKEDPSFIYENELRNEFTQGKFKCVTIPIKEINEPKKISRKIVIEKFSNEFDKRFNKFIQGKAFEKLDKELQKDCLNSYIKRIQERIKQLDG